MPNVMQLLPMLEPDEMIYIQNFMKEMDDTKAQQFAAVYHARRKDTQTVLIATLVGFFGIGGVQRFLLQQTAMGMLYLFTLGLCFIGTIVDLVNHRQLTLEYNIQVAREVIQLLKSQS